MLRSSIRGVLPRRSWQNLSALASGPKNAEAWSELRSRDAKLDLTVQSHPSPTDTTIDWAHWENSIAHQSIVQALKHHHEEQSRNLDAILQDNNANTSSSAWELHQNAVKSLEKAVEDSDKIVQSGVRALWISANNPKVAHVKTNEWLDTDLYFQAVMDRLAPLASTGYRYRDQRPHSDEEMFDSLDLLDKRSDVKKRNNYMAQLHSYEYYDIHRRALVEHMTYFLLRTGSNVRFFPEIPPMQWLAHIEEIRAKFVNVTHRRRVEKQLASLDMNEPLDLNPVDYSQGEDHFAQLVQDEMANTEMQIGVMMGYFGFLSAPYVPVRSKEEVVAVVNRAGGAEGGKWFSLGDDVSAVFFLPQDQTLVKPGEALNVQMDHMTMRGEKFLPGYSDVLESAAELVEMRGEHWLVAPGESVADAFLRRLPKDDVARGVFEEYVAELKSRMEKAKELTREEVIARIEEVESLARDEKRAMQEEDFKTLNF